MGMGMSTATVTGWYGDGMCSGRDGWDGFKTCVDEWGWAEK